MEPGSLRVADIHVGLTAIALRQNDDAEAEVQARQALALLERLAPDNASLAYVLDRLGSIERRRGHLREALELITRSLDVLESQVERLGEGSDRRSSFLERFHEYYRAQVEVLLELDRPEEAFFAVERSRVRTLIEMLSRRKNAAGNEVPAELRERRQQLGRDYDRILSELSGLRVTRDAERIDSLLASLRELRAQRELMADAVRRTSPRAATRLAAPVDAGRARAALSPGTVLLSYLVAPDRTWLFVLTRDGLSVQPLAIGEPELREHVDGFRRMVSRPKSPVTAALLEKGGLLFERLVRPAGGVVDGAERLLICPDGPLHLLPWGALVHTEKDGRRRWLVEWKPHQLVASATVYEALRSGAERGERRFKTTLVAFGDPKYSAGTFAPLPSTRVEVARILEAFQAEPDEVRAYLGADASEDAVKAVGSDVRYLHLACHAFADANSALDSALVLSTPEANAGGSNGQLQAWEIMAEMNLAADLVTLSACESGFGTERKGEGIVGLARAFQLAGARSVLASLWSVADESTAVLMPSFYRHLKAGMPKGDALRRAQLELVRGKNREYVTPFHWAPFQLVGDGD
jgi:CHAT domain-containing protein